MIIGKVLQVLPEGNFPYYGPWMPAKGNMAVVTCDVIQTENVQSFAITVETKNSEESDKDQTSPAGGSSNSITLSTETLTKFNVGAKLSDTVNAGFKELCRYRFVLTGADGGTHTGFVHFRMLDPAWLSN